MTTSRTRWIGLSLLSAIFLFFTLIAIAIASYQHQVGLPCPTTTVRGTLQVTRLYALLEQTSGNHTYLAHARKGDDDGTLSILGTYPNGTQVQAELCGRAVVRVFVGDRELFSFNQKSIDYKRDLGLHGLEKIAAFSLLTLAFALACERQSRIKNSIGTKGSSTND